MRDEKRIQGELKNDGGRDEQRMEGEMNKGWRERFY